MYTSKTEIVARIPVRRWRTTRFVVPVRKMRRCRPLPVQETRPQKRTQRGSFTETDARAP
jgi:hypothetical protein